MARQLPARSVCRGTPQNGKLGHFSQYKLTFIKEIYSTDIAYEKKTFNRKAAGKLMNRSRAIKKSLIYSTGWHACAHNFVHWSQLQKPKRQFNEGGHGCSSYFSTTRLVNCVDTKINRTTAFIQYIISPELHKNTGQHSSRLP